MPSKFGAEIVKTIAYFDLFSYPLTTLEIWQNLGCKASYGEMRKELFELKILKFANGMWTLNDSNIVERQRRYRISKHKLDKAKKFANFLKFIPWIEAVYACNSLGYLNSVKESDIDFFIVAKPGRIWTTRFFAVLLAKLFGKRPNKSRRKDTLCLSFYSIDGADMEMLSIKDDIYYQLWMVNLMPLVIKPGAARRFLQRNKWVNSFLPNAKGVQPPSSLIIPKKNKVVEKKNDNFLERILKKLQLFIMPASLKAMANKNTSVVLNDKFLKFHDHDKRHFIKNQLRARVEQILA